MNVQDFLKFFTSIHGNRYWSVPGGLLVSTYNDTGIPWEFRYQLAEELKDVDFKCDFKRGRCTQERNDWIGMRAWIENPDSNIRVNRCCSQCYLTIGNLMYLQNNDEVLDEITTLFDPELRGFWRQDVGCILPHKYRSTICLTGRCTWLRQQSYKNEEFRMSEADLMKVYRLSNIRSIWKRSRK